LLSSELNEDGREESTSILFSRVLEIGKVGHMCYPVFGDEFDILDNRRASNISNLGLDEWYRVTYVTTLLPEPTTKFKISYDTEDAEERGNVRFPWIHRALSNLNVLLSMNHVVVPSRCVSHAMK
jgi:hypothetical protein